MNDQCRAMLVLNEGVPTPTHVVMVIEENHPFSALQLCRTEPGRPDLLPQVDPRELLKKSDLSSGC